VIQRDMSRDVEHSDTADVTDDIPRLYQQVTSYSIQTQTKRLFSSSSSSFICPKSARQSTANYTVSMRQDSKATTKLH